GKDFGFTIQGFGRQGHGGVAIKNLRVPGNGLIERGAPLRQTALLCEKALIFIRDIVNEPHESIESGQGVALGLRQKKESVVEIAVRGTRDAMAFFVGLRQVHSVQWRRVSTGRVLCPGHCRLWQTPGCARISTYQVCHEGAAKQGGLLQFADGWAIVKRVISHRFDGIEDCQPAARKHLHVYTEASIHHFCKRPAFREEGASADYEVFHYANVALIEAPLDVVIL